MRKFTAIILLSIFTFNMVGYQLVYNYFTGKSDAALELALDEKKYNDEDLIMIRQQTNLPYYNSTKEFQRIDGEAEIDGIKYKYVKCRIYNGFLEMLCIPNKSKMKIEQSKNDYAKFANDFQQDNKEKKSSNGKSSQKQVSEYEELQSFSQQITVVQNGSFILFNTSAADQYYFNPAEQPPDAATA